MRIVEIIVSKNNDLTESTSDLPDLLQVPEWEKRSSNNTRPDFWAMGFWFNPKTGEYHKVTWNFEKEEDDIHHLDIFLKHHKEWGFKTPDTWMDFGTDEAVYAGVNLGWVRIHISQRGINVAATIDVKNMSQIRPTVRWMLQKYPLTDVQVDIVGKKKYIRLTGRDIDIVAKGGKPKGSGL